MCSTLLAVLRCGPPLSSGDNPIYAALYVLRISVAAAVVVTSMAVVAEGPPSRLLENAYVKIVGGGCWLDGSTNCPTLPAGKTPVCSQQECQTSTTCGFGDGYAQLRTTFKNAYESSTDPGRDGQHDLPEVYCWSQVHCKNPGDECRPVGQKHFCRAPDADDGQEFGTDNSKATPTEPDPNTPACTRPTS